MDVNSIDKIKNKLWRNYPHSVLDLCDEWAVVKHPDDMADLRRMLGQKWFNFVFDNATYYVARAKK